MDNQYPARQPMQPPPPVPTERDILHEKYKKLKRRYAEMEQKFNSMSLDLQRAGEQNRRLTRERDMLLDKIIDQGHPTSPGSSSNSVSGPSRSQQEPYPSRSAGTPLRPIGEAELQSILDEDSDEDMMPPTRRSAAVDFDRSTHPATTANGSEQNGNRDREYSVPDRERHHGMSYPQRPGSTHAPSSAYPPHEHPAYSRYPPLPPPPHPFPATQSHPAHEPYYPSYAAQTSSAVPSPPLAKQQVVSPPPGFTPARFSSPANRQPEYVSQKRSHDEDESVRKRQKLQTLGSGHLAAPSASTKPVSSASSQHSGPPGSPPLGRIRSRAKGRGNEDGDPVGHGPEASDPQAAARKRKSRARIPGRDRYMKVEYGHDPEQHRAHHPPPPHHGYGPPMSIPPHPMPMLGPGMMPPPMPMHVPPSMSAPVPGPPIPPPMLPGPPPHHATRPPRLPSPAIPPPSMPTNIIRTGSTPPRVTYSPAPSAPPPSGPPPRDRSQAPPPPPPPLAPPRPRSTKPKRLKAHTVQSRSYSIPTIPRNADGQPHLPLHVGIMTIRNLGRVCLDRHFHTERYIFPIGYEVTRRYFSMYHPDSEAQYTCMILHGEEVDGGTGPRFRIIPSDDPDNVITAGTATGAWSVVVRAANKVRNRQHSNSVSGPDYFGLGQNTIKHLLQELENADLLMDYVRQNFVEGGSRNSRPLGGRHAAVTPALDSDEARSGEMAQIEEEGRDEDVAEDATMNTAVYALRGSPSGEERSSKGQNVTEQTNPTVGVLPTHGRNLRRRSPQRRYGSPAYSNDSNE